MYMSPGQTAHEDPAGEAPVDIDLSRVDRTPGVHVASMLFDRGLWFEAVERGLRNEFGFTSEQAFCAATVAAALRIK
jgi:hypothetical protein